MHLVLFPGMMGCLRHLHKPGRSNTPMMVTDGLLQWRLEARWKKTALCDANWLCSGHWVPYKVLYLQIPSEFLCHDDTWVLLAETGIPANLQAASAPWVVCSLCPCSPACACCSIVHLPCVCGILALFIYVIKILHLCVTDTHLEVICKWLKQQWSEPVRSGPPRALPQQLKKCVLQKMLT